MRVRVIFVVLALLSLGIAAVWAQQPQQPQQPSAPPPDQPVPQGETIRREVNLVNVLFNVVNQRNRNVVDLNQSDFQVFDDNMPQEIRFFSRQNDLPLRVGLLLDTSNSIRARLQFEQEAAVDFLYNLLRKDKDQAFLMSVDDSPEIVQDFTGDLDRLRDVIQHLRAGGGTALYDAVYQASKHMAAGLAQPAGAPLEARGILVIISDGDDNVSRYSRGEAVQMAQRAGIVMYTISSSTDWIVTNDQTKGNDSGVHKFFKTEGERVLQQFADESGGQAFFPYHVDDLAASFGRIGEELRTQYSLAYVPAGHAADGKFHNIRVAVGVRGYKVQARNGYYADPSAAFGTTAPSPASLR